MENTVFKRVLFVRINSLSWDIHPSWACYGFSNNLHIEYLFNSFLG